MPVRSLLLATSFPPATGGMETLLYQTNRRLPRSPLVLAPAPAQATDMRVWPVHTSPRGLASRAAYGAAWRLHPSLHYLRTFLRPALAAMRHERPAVLQCGHVYLAPLTWLLARRAKLPFIVYAYGQEVWRGGRREGLRALDQRLRGQALAQADTVLSLGSFTSSLLLEWGVLPERIAVIPFGADPRPPAAPPSGATLLSVSRLVPRKGVDTVIRALPRVAERVPDVTYHVVGAGPDEPRLRALAREMGVAERVQLLGRVGDAQLAQEYQACALFVLPSRRTPEGELEGLGLVYLEAAAWGRPSVAGRSGGEPDAVLDGMTGLVVDGASPEAVADAIASLLRDQPRLRTLGAAARRRVETTFTWSNAAQTLNGLLERLAPLSPSGQERGGRGGEVSNPSTGSPPLAVEEGAGG